MGFLLRSRSPKGITIIFWIFFFPPVFMVALTLSEKKGKYRAHFYVPFKQKCQIQYLYLTSERNRAPEEITAFGVRPFQRFKMNAPKTNMSRYSGRKGALATARREMSRRVEAGDVTTCPPLLLDKACGGFGISCLFDTEKPRARFKISERRRLRNVLALHNGNDRSRIGIYFPFS